MYHTPAAPRRPEEETGMAREGLNGSSHPTSHPPPQQSPQQQSPPHPPLPPYQSRSPSGGHAYPSYSPPNGSHAPTSYNPPPPYPSRPSSGSGPAPPTGVDRSPHIARPASPSNAAMPGFSSRSPYKPTEAKSSTFYDPMFEHREPREPSWNQSPYSNRSPNQPHERTPYDSPSHERAVPRSPTAGRLPAMPSPSYGSRALHQPRADPAPPAPSSVPSSPPRKNQSSIANLVNGTIESSAPPPRPVEPAPAPRADPMSFSSILSTPSTDRAEPPKPQPPPPTEPATVRDAHVPPPPPPAYEPGTKITNGDAKPSEPVPEPVAADKMEIVEPAPKPLAPKEPSPETTRTPTGRGAGPKKPRKSNAHADSQTGGKGTTKSRANKASHANKPLSTAQIDEALRRIDNMPEEKRMIPNTVSLRGDFENMLQARDEKLAGDEDVARQKRRTYTISKTSLRIDKSVLAARENFRNKYEESVMTEVSQQEVMDEKERKKDMQRKRRREKTIHTETEKLKAIRERFERTTDEREREKLIKDHQKAQKKVNTTKRVLHSNATLPEELDEVVQPLPIDPAAYDLSPMPARRGRGRVGGRLKKTKEQKKAEKAKALNAALESSPVPIAPKEERTRKEAPGDEDGKPAKRRRIGKKAQEEESPAPPQTTYSSKGYHQIYEQIWKDIARKDIPKVYRIKENSLTTKQSNLRKTAQLASKEARRWQLRTNKSTKDTQARAKRCMREMMSFWKRNEREERDLRRVAERAELEAAKKAEAEREAARQRRKLEFLINQTELYSHFIGKKVKTDEVERSTDSKDVGVSQETIQDGSAAKVVDLPSDQSKVGDKVTNFEDLDFDAEDETALQEAAMANAQHAVQEAQNKARAFNQGGEETMAQFDEGELNFQNPTGLGETDIEQPKMLNCQLKEYQLKGLNWLVNLYEQGINGILADEMGLGKTVQSISVMAYLAEKHNIWGPFLVIAPSSTLHNWQQEIARFVPGLKVVPYWGSLKDRKVLRKFWDRKHITYSKDSEFHVLITSYQLVVQDSQYFQKMRWQYMVLDEAQAIKSSQSSRWKNLLGFHCRNRLLLTGTPIQNNMQELWALLHFIMPSLFDSHDEFSDWFSRDIENHAQSNTKLNEDQLKRLHMILKPFMLRRVKKHVQKELGDKVEKDIFCNLTYRQRAYYSNLRNKISIMDLIEKAASGDDNDTSTLMNLVMQFRKVCNHPDLFERAEIHSPMAMAYFAETGSFIREGQNINVGYSTRNLIDYDLPRLICSEGILDQASPENPRAGFKRRYLGEMFNIWTPENMHRSDTFSFLRLTDSTATDAYAASHKDLFARAVRQQGRSSHRGRFGVVYDEDPVPKHSMLNIVDRNDRRPLAEVTDGYMANLLNVSRGAFKATGLGTIEQCARPAANAPPIEIACSSRSVAIAKENLLFNREMRAALFSLNHKEEQALVKSKLDPLDYPPHDMLPAPISDRARYTNIAVPSMRRFVTDSGKLNKLDQLLRTLKEEGHRVLLYFQMTRMIDLMEEYLTYRNYKYLRLDGSTKLEDRRDTVHDFQTRPDIFIFLLSTRAGGLGINLTAADTVIFYDSDWNPTIDSQAMDRAHRLGQTKQVTVYRMITRGTIEERIRKRALQKEEVQRVVISGGSGVDFNTRSKETKTKDIAMWLADDDQAEMIEQRSKELEEQANDPANKTKRKKGSRKKGPSMDDMYHEGEGHFDDGSAKPSAAGTPMDSDSTVARVTKRAGGGRGGGRGLHKKSKAARQRLAEGA